MGNFSEFSCRNYSDPLCQRKRRRLVVRVMGHSSALVLAATAAALVVCVHVSTATAFVNPTALVSSRPASSLLFPKSSTSALWQVMDPPSHPGEDDDDDNAAGWLSWMARGQKKGVSDVKMREAEELGGVPRSDRYSSRYVRDNGRAAACCMQSSHQACPMIGDKQDLTCFPLSFDIL